MAGRIKPIGEGPISKTRKGPQQKHRVVDEKHLAFIRTLPCCVTGKNGCVAHHLTVGRNRMGRKAGDDETVPLLPKMHDGFPGSLHSIGESNFWNRAGIDPSQLAEALYRETGDYARCVTEIRALAAAAQVRKARGAKVF